MNETGDTNIEGEVGYVVGERETDKGAVKNGTAGSLHLDRHGNVLDRLVWVYVDVKVS